MKLTEFKEIEPLTPEQLNNDITKDLANIWGAVGGYIRYGMEKEKEQQTKHDNYDD